MTTIEGLCNQALDDIKYPRHIGNIYEGTKAARVALNLWGQTRDAVFSEMEPNWSVKNAVLVLNKQAPNIVNGTANYLGVTWDPALYPPLPWLYEYVYPTDCIEPKQIKGAPGIVPLWRPRFNPFRRTTISTLPTILTNVPDAILTYIAAVHDPNDWQPDFTERFIAVLVTKFRAALGQPLPPKQEPQPQNDSNTAG